MFDLFCKTKCYIFSLLSILVLDLIWLLVGTSCLHDDSPPRRAAERWRHEGKCPGTQRFVGRPGMSIVRVRAEDAEGGWGPIHDFDFKLPPEKTDKQKKVITTYNINSRDPRLLCPGAPNFSRWTFLQDVLPHVRCFNSDILCCLCSFNRQTPTSASYEPSISI